MSLQTDSQPTLWTTDAPSPSLDKSAVLIVGVVFTTPASAVTKYYTTTTSCGGHGIHVLTRQRPPSLYLKSPAVQVTSSGVALALIFLPGAHLLLVQVGETRRHRRRRDQASEVHAIVTALRALRGDTGTCIAAAAAAAATA
eukprot:CAMPEP_0181365872 /NCGR_PEP_ID=MMETSP1106-20121128/10346_1 /TAXON_ID=81844 /ORGANISM="Mantoniella antarctica, Strain SL-175" /LENGTH=141 /DNA_ID=CAMNT_0023481071 /DNA_START=271 /DNA_END=693 /DNA_ORIENTATION=-